jgi:hypothetical protein
VLDTTDMMALEDAYDADGPAAVAAFRAAGALVFVPHTESRELDYLRGLGMDGVEIFNTHATVAPDIRTEYLGLPSDFLGDLLLFTRGGGPPPDLAFIAFFAENTPSVQKWDELLSEGQRIMGIAGNDAHENALPQILPDGERADSFRRMMRWSSNVILVNERSLAGVREALLAARGYVAFEAFGTPIGFDFHAEEPDGTTAEAGGAIATGATLTVTRPSLPAGHPQDPPPLVRLRILRAAPGGAVEVAAGEGETLTHVATDPGAYRAEARITPEHFRPYLSARLAERLLREQPWVYSNAIHVQAP